MRTGRTSHVTYSVEVYGLQQRARTIHSLQVGFSTGVGKCAVRCDEFARVQWDVLSRKMSQAALRPHTSSGGGVGPDGDGDRGERRTLLMGTIAGRS